ncbi:MAG: hypothetical protein JXR97_05465 [Planctomycetes bacterium]|nr:hypothetical protein [Planctomycetota bacterium]
MIIDYTEIFRTPEELANFLILPQEEQLEKLSRLAAGIQNVVMTCELSKKGKTNE